MRTASEMTAHILSKEEGPKTAFKDSMTAKRVQLLNGLFRPIEQLLRSNTGPEAEVDDDILIGLTGGRDDVFYTLTSLELSGDREADRLSADPPDTFIQLSALLPSLYGGIAAAFMANRCIITYATKESKEVIWTIPYDEIIGITPTETRSKGDLTGELALATTSGQVIFSSWGSIEGRKKRYCQFVPDQAGAAVLELVTKYKRARYTAQQAAARAQTAPQPAGAAAPAAPPAGAGPQDEVIETLKKFKDLLDAGILTQEEFDAKKKQLLGL